MADPRDNQHNQEKQYDKDHHWTREDFAACASANANYYYQMSLWWWNTYMHNLHAGTQPWTSQFADQSCECAERSLFAEDDCECCQNNGSFESQGHQMNPCKDCPQLYPGPPWQSLQDEYSSSSGNHRDLRFRQNNDSDKDNDENNDGDKFPGGDEDCDDRSDDNDDNDDFDDNSNNNDDEDSDMDMEVDDDFRKFLEQSEKHRQEREQSKLSINCLGPKVNRFGFLPVILTYCHSYTL